MKFKIPKRQKSLRRQLAGAESKFKGQRGEGYFENQCRIERLCFFKIHDGEPLYPNNPKMRFLKKAQVCDYVVSIGGHFWLLDTKIRKSYNRSLFFSAPLARKTSTQNQTEKFINAFKQGNHRCGFLFRTRERQDTWLFIGAKVLFASQKDNKLQPKPIEIYRIQELESLK